MMGKQKRVLIIGGSGFIGSNAAPYFQDNFEVFLLDKVFPNFQYSEFPFYHVNIRNQKDLQQVFFQVDPAWILHLASKSTVIACHDDPEEAFLDNVIGTLNVLIAARKMKESSTCSFQKLIVHTSDKVYGEYPESHLPYLEAYPHYRADVYSTSKASQDMMTLCMAKQYNLPFSTIRSGNIFGPKDLNFSRLIPNTIKRVLEGKNAVIHEGNENAKRDFVYINDLLNAYKFVFEKGKNGEAYNVGGSGPTTVIEVINLIKERMNQQKLKIDFLKNDLPSFKTQYLSSEKLKQLGWNSQTPLNEGIESCVAFYKGYFCSENS